MGIHPAYDNLSRDYSLASDKLLTKLQTILSCLAHYSSIFSEVEYLPELIYPFVKLFANDELLCFETTLTFFLQWGQHFFTYFPNPPINLIQATEEILKFHEFDLYTHFKKIGLNMVDYVWPFLQSIFTTVLSKEDWLSLMDFLVLHNQEPLYLLFFIVSYLCYFKGPLMKIEVLEDIEYFLQKQNAVNIRNIIKNMRYCRKNTPSSVSIVTFQNYIPFKEGQYPIFNFYPEYSVEYHRKIREQFIREQKKLESKKERIRQVQVLTDELLEQERRFRDKQEGLVKAQRDRKDLLILEEERRLQQKLSIETESRERRISQLKRLEEAIQTSLKQQNKLSDKEINELEQELELQSKIDQQLIQSRLEEEALLNLEFQAAQRLNEITELRNTEERARRIRTEMDYTQRQNRLRDRVWDENLRAEDEEFKLRMDIIRHKKLLELNQEQEVNDKKELELKLLTEGLEKELKLKDVERERNLRRIAQEEVFRNEEYIKIYKENEDKFKVEDEKHMTRILNREKQNAVKRANETLANLEKEKRLLTNEIDKYKTTIKERTINLKKDEFEDQVIAIRREKELKLLEEERELQKMMLDIEEQRKFQREMQQELIMKERDFQEKEGIYQTLKRDEERVVNEERRNFADFREAFRDELNKIEDMREKMAEARLSQLKQHNEGLIHQNTDDIRKRAQTENMSKYLEELNEQKRSYTNLENAASVRERSQRSHQARGNEIRVEGILIDQGLIINP